MKTLLSVFCLILVLAASAHAGDGRTVVMLGDSLTHRFDWAKALPEYTVYNLGVNGDTTGDVLARLDEVVAKKPDAIFLQVGINDLGLFYARRGGSENPDRQILAILSNHKKIWDTLLRKSPPGVRLHVCSCLPVSGSFGGYGKSVNSSVRTLNALLEKEARSRGLVYIDLYRALCDENGDLAERFDSDGIHLLPEGYAVWLETLRAGEQDREGMAGNRKK
jgi:lysophospholipase L1-like esterase